MVDYGNASAFVRLLIHLTTLGPVPVIIGKGVVLLVGRSTRGPVDEAVAMTSAAYAKTYFHGGDLKNAIELAFGQGAPVVYAIRVLGTRYTTATITMADGLGTNVVTVDAAFPGNWGNSLSAVVTNGSQRATEFNDGIPGDGSSGPYFTKMHDILQDTSNWVAVDGTLKEVIYTSPPGPDQAYVDTVNGSIEFNADVQTSSLISYFLKYRSKKLTVTDNETTVSYDNISSLVKLVARLIGTGFISATIEPGQTHLPANGTYRLVGGSDGLAITTEDWARAIRQGANDAAELVGAPQTCAITEYEVEVGTHDLIPEVDAISQELANKFHPAQWFVSLAPNLSVAQVLDIAAGYSNRLLTLVANGWDRSSTPRCIAVARAGKEAAVALGESCALPRNAMNGLNGLLNTFSQVECDVLTQDTDARADVIIKTRGIRPYVGVTTDQTWQFLRTVDNRTINWVIVGSAQIAEQFFHEKRTPQILASMKRSIQSMMEDLRRDQNVRAYTVKVQPHDTDTGRVLIFLNMENIGHIERIDETIAVGIIQGAGMTSEELTSV